MDIGYSPFFSGADIIPKDHTNPTYDSDEDGVIDADVDNESTQTDSLTARNTFTDPAGVEHSSQMAEVSDLGGSEGPDLPTLYTTAFSSISGGYPGTNDYRAASVSAGGMIERVSGQQWTPYTQHDTNTSSQQRGLSIDTTDGLFWVTTNNATIQKLDLIGGATVVSEIDPVTEDPWNIAYDPFDGTLWYTVYNGNIYNIDQQGNELSFHTHPGTGYLVGIAIDWSDHSIWTMDKDEGAFYNFQRDGTVISSFSRPGTGNQFDLGVDPADGTLWYAVGDQIYHVDRTGAIIDQFTGPTAGTDYLGIQVDPLDGSPWLVENDYPVNITHQINRWTDAMATQYNDRTFLLGRP